MKYIILSILALANLGAIIFWDTNVYVSAFNGFAIGMCLQTMFYSRLVDKILGGKFYE